MLLALGSWPQATRVSGFVHWHKGRSVAHDCNAGARGTRLKASRVAEVLRRCPMATRWRGSARCCSGKAGIPSLAGTECLAACRAQSGYRLAFQQDRAGIVQVIAVCGLARDVLDHGGPKCVPASFREGARSLGLTPIG